MPGPITLLLADAMDGMSDGAAVLMLFVLPLGVFHAVYGVVQFAAIFFVWIRAARAYRKKQGRDIIDLFKLIAWVVGGYVGAVTLTNLLLLGWVWLSGG